MPLSQDLCRRCRNALLQCSEFDSDALLRTVFVAVELYPFRNGLPNSASKNERVDMCLDYLLSKQFSDGRSVISLFLKVLCERQPEGDALRDELEALCLEVDRYLDVQADQNEVVKTDLQSVYAAIQGTKKQRFSLRDFRRWLHGA